MQNRADITAVQIAAGKNKASEYLFHKLTRIVCGLTLMTIKWIGKESKPKKQVQFCVLLGSSESKTSKFLIGRK